MIEIKFLGWVQSQHFLYVFGFLQNFSPIDPYLYEMLTTTKNITQEQYTKDILPISAYTTISTSLIIFFLVSFCMFNYFLVVSCVGSIAFAVFVWQFDSLVQLQIAEGFKGCVVACEIVYFASVYVCTDSKKNVARLTAYIRAVPLAAKMMAGFLAEALVSNDWLRYKELAFISVPVCMHATLLNFNLPELKDWNQASGSFRSKLSSFRTKIADTFSNKDVLKLSLWSAFTICGYTHFSTLKQIILKIQQLDNQDPDDEPYNGMIDGISSFLSLVAVILSGNLVPGLKYTNVMLMITSLVQAIILYLLTTIDDMWQSSICYIVFDGLYHFMVTLVFGTIASIACRKGSLAIVFGFIGLVFSVINLVIVCVIKFGYFTVYDQLMVCVAYHTVVALFMTYFCILKLRID